MMNNNDDYLWDKTGEPDPEIQELEQLLGTLRYQPRPLDIPDGIVPSQKRVLFPRLLAIAATIAVMLLGAGLWLSLHRRQGNEVSKVPNKAATSGSERTAVVVPDTGNDDSAAVSPRIEVAAKPNRHRVNHSAMSHEFANNRRPRVNTPALDEKERNEALAAKEQLMLALRVASSKLSFAQRKAQEINSENLIHNQHKIG
jgi:hypothetical protein